MKVLLLTDIPPCINFTAGLVLNQLVRFLEPDQLALCYILNPSLQPEIPPDFSTIPRLALAKPRESSFRIFPGALGELSATSFELIQALRVRFHLLPKISAFARQQKVDALWVVLQGQTSVRLAMNLAETLALPLFTQIWDPFDWWLRANTIDILTRRRLLAQYDETILSSTACATASWAMSKDYDDKYHVRNLPVIAGLPVELMHPSTDQPHFGEDFIIGFAGQFYAQLEWECLIQTLNAENWIIENRRIRIRALGGCFPSFIQKSSNFEYLGWKSQEETIKVLADSDLLYLPYWFSEEFREESSTSFPSKLVSYFASGRPVFCHAPPYSSPAKYISDNSAGFICESLVLGEVKNALSLAISDTNLYSMFSKNGTHCFLRDFTLESMKAAFLDFLRINPNAELRE